MKIFDVNFVSIHQIILFFNGDKVNLIFKNIKCLEISKLYPLLHDS